MRRSVAQPEEIGVKVDGGLLIGGLAEASARARALEADGYDGIVSAEVSNDPFLPLALAAEQTRYEMQFRADLAEIADRAMRGR